jgi:mannosyl-oligosaccharide alpha-1,2-mannosidase
MACIFMFQVENVIVQLNQTFPANGLLPIFVDPHRGTAMHSTITFGAMGDRYSPFKILL